MRISSSMLTGIMLLVATISYSIAEEVTLTTYYPSPRGVYNELQANIYRDFGDPSNRYLDPTTASQLQDLRIFGGITLAGRTIQKWEDIIPSGGILVYGVGSTCPSGFTKVTDYGRFPIIASSPGGTGGNASTGTPDALATVEVGGISVGSSSHRHAYTPPYREFVFCQRN